MKQSPVRYGGTRHGVPEGRLSSQFCRSSKLFQGSKLEKKSLFIYFFTQQIISENTEAMWECRTD